jgi:hypothetical protein
MLNEFEQRVIFIGAADNLKPYRDAIAIATCRDGYRWKAQIAYRPIDRAGETREKCYSKLALELPNELADRALRDTEFIGGFAEAPMAASDFECLETGQ